MLFVHFLKEKDDFQFNFMHSICIFTPGIDTLSTYNIHIYYKTRKYQMTVS